MAPAAAVVAAGIALVELARGWRTAAAGATDGPGARDKTTANVPS